MNILYDFSSALLQARQRKDVTQEQIAFALDISQATYNAWECGHRICPYKHIIALICYFDDDQFTRRMFRILLTLQHNMAGLNKKSKDELTAYYSRLISLLADESAEWIKTLQTVNGGLPIIFLPNNLAVQKYVVTFAQTNEKGTEVATTRTKVIAYENNQKNRPRVLS